MGQVALGFRSLLIKFAVFFVMAALLAWALGGTLWPKAQESAEDAVAFGGSKWFWKLAVGGNHAERVRWVLMQQPDGGKARPTDDPGMRVWRHVSGPVVASDGLYVGGFSIANGTGGWRVERRDKAGEITVYPMPDRLGVELQLERVKAGFPVQSIEEMAVQRAQVLNPQPATP